MDDRDEDEAPELDLFGQDGPDLFGASDDAPAAEPGIEELPVFDEPEGSLSEESLPVAARAEAGRRDVPPPPAAPATDPAALERPETPLALYRRYRPEIFAEVIGQEHVTEPLQRALRNNRVNHAYLFSGPRGCGKTTSARILARALNCAKGPTPVPCGECQSCRELARGGTGSIDVIEIDAASHGGVDDARDLRERAFFAPVHSRYKIYIIDEAHMVSTQGFNALLKVVEEPPPHVRFVFATTEPEKVIGTIRSRTHHYPFRLVPPKVLGDYLGQVCRAEGIAVEPAVLPLVVRAGAGSVRDSLSVLDQLLGAAGAEGVSYRQATSLLGYTPDALLDEIVDAFAAGDARGVFAAVDKVIEVGQDPRRFGEDLLRRLRDLIIVAAVPDAISSGLLDVAADQAERFVTQARALGPGELTRAAEVLAVGLTEMRGTTAPRLHLELMCARVLLPGADVDGRGLHARLDRLERRLGIDGSDTVGAPAEDTVRLRVPGSEDGGRATDHASGTPGAAHGEATGGSASGGPGGRGGSTGQRGAPGKGATGGVPNRLSGDETRRGAAADAPPEHAAVNGGPSGPSGVQDGPGSAEATAAHRTAGQPVGDRGAPDRVPGALTGDGTPAEAGRSRPAADVGGAQPAGPTGAGASAVVGDREWLEGGAGWGQPAPAGPAPDAPAGDEGPQPASGAEAAAPPPGPAPTAAAPGGFGTADLRRLWPDVLEEVKNRRRYTWILLSQNSQVVEVREGVLTLGIANSGAREGFGRGGHADILRESILHVVGVALHVEPIVDVGAGGGPESAAGAEAGQGSTPGVSTPTTAATPSPSATSPTAPTPSAPTPSGTTPPWESSTGEPPERPAGAQAARANLRATRSTGSPGSPVEAEPSRSDPDLDDGSSSEELLMRHLGAELIAEEDGA
ncbi:MAG TPA: DNA polymerase III subunit gamma and tau [Propionicimonas sp.]|nr:DNA polymerase III subunit gamma and tau [Propionicimonas sp.]